MSATVEVSASIEQQLPLEPPGGGQTSRSARDVGLILLVVFLLTLLLAGITYRVHWLRISRRNRQRERALIADSGSAIAGQASGPPRRRRRRRSKRANPSLAETGGLPPKRSRPSA